METQDSMEPRQMYQLEDTRQDPDAHEASESDFTNLDSFNLEHSRTEPNRTCDELLGLQRKAAQSAREIHEGLLKKIAQLEQAERELLESNERLRSVVESAHDPIVGADSQGRIIRWNTAETLTFGYTEKEVLNQPLSLLMPDRFVALHEAAMQRAVAVGSLYYSKRVREVFGRRKDGT